MYCSHLCETEAQELDHGKSFLKLNPDRAACHDATATMALLQFISAGLPEVQLPVTIHGDHLIVAEKGAEQDLENAKEQYREVSRKDTLNFHYAEISDAAGLCVLGFCLRKIQHWFLETWIRNHTHNFVRELCFVSECPPARPV